MDIHNESNYKEGVSDPFKGEELTPSTGEASDDTIPNIKDLGFQQLQETLRREDKVIPQLTKDEEGPHLVMQPDPRKKTGSFKTQLLAENYFIGKGFLGFDKQEDIQQAKKEYLAQLEEYHMYLLSYSPEGSDIQLLQDLTKLYHLINQVENHLSKTAEFQAFKDGIFLEIKAKLRSCSIEVSSNNPTRVKHLSDRSFEGDQFLSEDLARLKKLQQTLGFLRTIPTLDTRKIDSTIGVSEAAIQEIETLLPLDSTQFIEVKNPQGRFTISPVKGEHYNQDNELVGQAEVCQQGEHEYLTIKKLVDADFLSANRTVKVEGDTYSYTLEDIRNMDEAAKEEAITKEVGHFLKITEKIDPTRKTELTLPLLVATSQKALGEAMKEIVGAKNFKKQPGQHFIETMYDKDKVTVHHRVGINVMDYDNIGDNGPQVQAKKELNIYITFDLHQYRGKEACDLDQTCRVGITVSVQKYPQTNSRF